VNYPFKQVRLSFLFTIFDELYVCVDQCLYMNEILHLKMIMSLQKIWITPLDSQKNLNYFAHQSFGGMDFQCFEDEQVFWIWNDRVSK